MSQPTSMIDGEISSRYSWEKSSGDASIMTRNFANLERMFVILNENLYGQNCPFMGAKVSLRGNSKEKPLGISELHNEAVKAFCQTRWKYPTVAARILNDKQASYPIEDRESVEAWAHRTVFTISREGGWLTLMEKLSQESSLPTTPDRECCLFYLIVSPEEAQKSEISSFDILMRVHHALIDGSGMRIILNEFLERLVDPLSDEELAWGKEIPRLLPAAILLLKPDGLERDSTLVSKNGGVRPFDKPDVGLPVYRSDIGAPKPEHRGTSLVSHTFDDFNFLSRLKNAGRKHGVKLTSILHASMLKAVYDISDVKPISQDIYYSGSPMSLRNGHLLPEYCNSYKYVNLAVAIQSIGVPCKFFGVNESGQDRIWEAALCIQQQWEDIKLRKDLAMKGDSDAKRLVESLTSSKVSPKPSTTKPRTCPSFASDPSGSPELSSIYRFGSREELELVLDSYQIASEQMQTVISSRSHSWNGLLTLCLVFNTIRNPKEKVELFLQKWCEILARINGV